MHVRHQLPKLAIIVLLICVAGAAYAFPSSARKAKMSCATCHVKPSGGVDLTDAGKAYKADNTKVPTTSVAGADYQGSNKCKMCHKKEHTSWLELKHAHAFEVLVSGDPAMIDKQAAAAGVKLTGPASANPVCLGCHTVGYGLPGGYPPADTSKTASFQAVGCEMCHGPSSKHTAAEKGTKKNFISIPKTDAMCKDCHTAAMSPKFAFDEYAKKAAHALPDSLATAK
jgi:hypothetical protein